MEKGGRTKRIAEELRGLAELGHNVKLITFSEPPDWVRERYPGSEEWLVVPKSRGVDVRLLWRLHGIFRDFKPEIIDAHCEGSALYAGLVSRFAGCRCVATVHRSSLRYYESNWRIRSFYRFVDGCIAVSEQRRPMICKALSLPEDRVAVMHWGTEISAPSELPSRAEARDELGLGSEPAILSVGHLGLIKGHDDSIAAMAQLAQLHPDAHLYIAGDGVEADYRRLRDQAKSHGVESMVTLLGETKNVLDWMCASDVFLQPSREEAFGLVFLEAGMCGLPTVATYVGGIPEIIVHGETGLLVSPENAQEIATALEQMLASPKRCAEMGHAARDRVKDHFELRKCVSRLAAHLQMVAAR